MKATYTVCTVNWKSAKYIRFLDHTLRKLADAPDFRWLICDTNETADETAELESLGGTVVRHDVGSAVGSVAHGAAFNRIAPLIDTPYAVLLDPDAAVLVQGWDTRCLEALKDRSVVAVGAPYHPELAVERYGDFPTVFFCMYPTEFLKRPGIDFRPGWHAGLGRARSLALRLAGKFDRDRDTGYKLRDVAHAAGKRGLCFDTLTAASPRARVLTHGERGDEFHWQGEPIFTHQGRSSSRVPFQDSISVRWFHAVCRYLGLDPHRTSDELGLRLARRNGEGPRGALVTRLDAALMPEDLKAAFFADFSTFIRPELPASLAVGAEVIVAAHMDRELRDAAERGATVLTSCACPPELAHPRVVEFRGGFELATLLSRLPRGTRVVTRHQEPALVYATGAFPELVHVFRPHGPVRAGAASAFMTRRFQVAA